jgi:hypothetical protein
LRALQAEAGVQAFHLQLREVDAFAGMFELYAYGPSSGVYVDDEVGRHLENVRPRPVQEVYVEGVCVSVVSS